jgi:hypothetical protein
MIEVHHIIPEAEEGPNTLDNAAPLCAGCHSIYGGNPVFRKQIRQMRDNWYDVCEKRFSPLNFEVAQQLNTMTETLRTVRADQVKYQSTLNEIKATLMGSLSATSAAINRAQTYEDVVTASGYPGSTGPGIYAPYVKCRKCGWSDFVPGGDIKRCPQCGTLI